MALDTNGLASEDLCCIRSCPPCFTVASVLCTLSVTALHRTLGRFLFVMFRPGPGSGACIRIHDVPTSTGFQTKGLKVVHRRRHGMKVSNGTRLTLRSPTQIVYALCSPLSSLAQINHLLSPACRWLSIRWTIKPHASWRTSPTWRREVGKTLRLGWGRPIRILRYSSSVSSSGGYSVRAENKSRSLARCLSGLHRPPSTAASSPKRAASVDHPF